MSTGEHKWSCSVISGHRSLCRFFIIDVVIDVMVEYSQLKGSWKFKVKSISDGTRPWFIRGRGLFCLPCQFFFLPWFFFLPKIRVRGAGLSLDPPLSIKRVLSTREVSYTFSCTSSYVHKLVTSIHYEQCTTYCQFLQNLDLHICWNTYCCSTSFQGNSLHHFHIRRNPRCRIQAVAGVDTYQVLDLKTG